MGQWALHEEQFPGAGEIMQLQLCTKKTSENFCLARVGYLRGAGDSDREGWGEQV
jgi:hypothetical protein